MPDDTTAPVAPVAPTTPQAGPTAESSPKTVVVGNANPPTEKSNIGRFVAFFTPVFAIAAGWLAGVVARHVPGAHLDPNQVTAFMVAAVTSALASAIKWLHGWQQHERMVAEGKATPVRSA